MSAKDTQIGGDHYKRMSVEPWAAMESWLTPKEYRGYLKGTAIAYLARDGDKPETDDIGKAHHVLEHYLEVRGPLPEETPAAREVEWFNRNYEPGDLVAVRTSLTKAPVVSGAWVDRMGVAVFAGGMGVAVFAGGKGRFAVSAVRREEDPPLLVTNPLPPLPEGVDLAALAPKLRTGKL